MKKYLTVIVEILKIIGGIILFVFAFKWADKVFHVKQDKTKKAKKTVDKAFNKAYKDIDDGHKKIKHKRIKRSSRTKPPNS